MVEVGDSAMSGVKTTVQVEVVCRSASGADTTSKAIDRGVKVSQYKASLHPPGSRTRKRAVRSK